MVMSCQGCGLKSYCVQSKQNTLSNPRTVFLQNVNSALQTQSVPLYEKQNAMFVSILEGHAKICSQIQTVAKS